MLKISKDDYARFFASYCRQCEDWGIRYGTQAAPMPLGEAFCRNYSIEDIELRRQKANRLAENMILGKYVV